MSEFKHLAQAIATAEVESKRSRKALAAADADRAHIAGRICALTEERDRIAAARRSGVESEEHGPRLAVLGLDLEDLERLLAEAEIKVATVRTAVEDSARAVAAAERALTGAEDQAHLAALIAHASRLDELLLATTTEIGALGKRLGLTRHPWAPSEATHTVVNKLWLTRVRG